MAANDPRDLARTTRAALLALEELRSDVHALAARVVAMGEQLAALTPDRAATDRAIEARVAELTPAIAAADAHAPGRVQLGDDVDKYAIATDGGPPCLELLPICQGRCCQLDFALSPQDLDEGVVEWEPGQPYLIRHVDGHCVHQVDGACGCYPHRPAPCRAFDCRDDPRIWRDFARRELAPFENRPSDDNLGERRTTEAARSRALFYESLMLRRPR